MTQVDAVERLEATPTRAGTQRPPKWPGIAFHSAAKGWAAGRPFVRPLKGLREGARCRAHWDLELHAGWRASSSPSAAGEPADVLDLGVLVVGVGRLVAAVDPDLALDAEVVGGHQVVAERRRHMRDVLRPAAERVEHVLEAVHPRLVAAGLLGGEDRVERRAELLDVRHDLAVHRVREDHQRDLLARPWRGPPARPGAAPRSAPPRRCAARPRGGRRRRCACRCAPPHCGPPRRRASRRRAPRRGGRRRSP